MEDKIVRAPHSPEKQTLARQMRQEMTRAEKLLWQKLRRNRLAGLHFRRQQVIDGFIADFYCHAATLVVEVDGEIHERQVDYDDARDRVIAARGLMVLRFTNDRISQDLSSVAAEIRALALTRLQSRSS